MKDKKNKGRLVLQVATGMLLIALLFSIQPAYAASYGDVSGDGQVSAYDAALVAQGAVGLVTLTPAQIQAADVSGDEQVSAYDAALIAQKAVGLINKFPVEDLAPNKILVPGTGWTGPTAQPAPIGNPTDAGYDAKAIARWDVVPYQMFNGDFNVYRTPLAREG